MSENIHDLHNQALEKLLDIIRTQNESIKIMDGRLKMHDAQIRALCDGLRDVGKRRWWPW